MTPPFLNVLRILPRLGLAGLAFLCGCSTYKDQARDMQSAWINGQVAVAAKEFGKRAERRDGGKDSVIWHLEAGAAYRAAGSYTNSLEHFRAAQSQIERFEEQAKIKVGREAAATFSNQQNLPYKGKPYDKIMLHTYLALDYLALNERDKARPEIIRAYQRQQDAVEENARRIEEAKQAETESQDRTKVRRAKQDPGFNAALQNTTKNLEGFKFYADYVNPFTVYLDGIFFLHAGEGGSDLERANKSLGRVIEVAGQNPFVKEDLDSAHQALAGQDPAPCTYVIFENGRGASYDQIRIDIPIIVTSVSYVGAAFPTLVRHGGEAPFLAIKTAEGETKTAPLSSMDAVVALDFKNEFPVIVTKTIIATVAKAAAAFAVNEVARNQDDLLGFVARLGTAATQAAMNIADTRSWTTLPKEFQVARFPTPADRRLTLSTGGGRSVEVNLLDAEVNVVYAKSITANGPLLVSQFKLK